MKVLAIGDIFGRPGRDAVSTLVPELRGSLGVDLVVANAENMAGGKGMTAKTLAELRAAGVDVVTSGNHVWDQREMLTYLGKPGSEWVLRPLNLPPGAPGSGYWLGDGVLIVNLMGRLFMRDIDDPFQAIDRLLDGPANDATVKIVDFHAEATSEKVAMAWHLNGRVSAVFGTHTHVPTADPRILPGGTAAITDLGMVGPHHSVIGMPPTTVVRGFLTALPTKFEVAEGPVQFNAVLIEIDERTGRAENICRVDRLLEG
jgi:2',3'-cyclic-nucleotide 2'-phosphodiesterase